MRVSFDSNAWEKIFDPTGSQFAPIHSTLRNGRLTGFICEAGFRIEAIIKSDRVAYFSQPYMHARFDGVVTRDGRPHLKMSFGPDDKHHPGLASVQANKLHHALSTGVLVMRGLAWLGLPSPQEVWNPDIFVSETREMAHEREQRQIDASVRIWARGVGKAAFDAAGGWNVSSLEASSEKKFRRACAEWADGELVAAHIAYRNDILCTDDHARTAGRSIFDLENREWLRAQYGLEFKTLDELTEMISG